MWRMDDTTLIVLILLGVFVGVFFSPIIMGNYTYQITAHEKTPEVKTLESQISQLEDAIQARNNEIKVLQKQNPNFSWIGLTMIVCALIITSGAVLVKNNNMTKKVVKKK